VDIFDIFIAYVSWENDSKHRPVLIVEQQNAILSVFNITTQYEGKSEIIRANYFKIVDWQQAGLNKQSYVDTSTLRDLPKAAWDGKIAIGKLTDADVQKLLEFLTK